MQPLQASWSESASRQWTQFQDPEANAILFKPMRNELQSPEPIYNLEANATFEKLNTSLPTAM